MRAEGSCTSGGPWSGAHVPLPAAPVVHQRPHITQLQHAADRVPTIALTDEPAVIPETLAAVTRLHDEGHNPTAIARRLGVSRRSVSDKLRAAGITPHDGRTGRVTKPNRRTIPVADLARRYEAGEELPDLAAEAGFSVRSVRQAIVAAGVTLRPIVVPRRYDAAQVVALLEQGMSRPAVAAQLGCAKTTVDRLAAEAGYQSGRVGRQAAS